MKSAFCQKSKKLLWCSLTSCLESTDIVQLLKGKRTFSCSYDKQQPAALCLLPYQEIVACVAGVRGEPAGERGGRARKKRRERVSFPSSSNAILVLSPVLLFPFLFERLPRHDGSENRDAESLSYVLHIVTQKSNYLFANYSKMTNSIWIPDKAIWCCQNPIEFTWLK